MTRQDATQHDERDLDPDEETGLKFLTPEDVAARVALSRRTIERYVDSGVFPTPVQITARRIVFIEEEVVAWMKQRIAESRGTA